MSLELRINGELRSVLNEANPTALDKVLTALSVRKELIAVALNDMIVPRTLWDQTLVSEGDRVEIVRSRRVLGSHEDMVHTWCEC